MGSLSIYLKTEHIFTLGKALILQAHHLQKESRLITDLSLTMDYSMASSDVIELSKFLLLQAWEQIGL